MRFLTFEEELAIDDEVFAKMLESYPNKAREDIKKIVFKSPNLLSNEEKIIKQQFSELWRVVSYRVMGK